LPKKSIKEKESGAAASLIYIQYTTFAPIKNSL